MSILDSLKGCKKATSIEQKVQMTEDYEKALKTKLMNENRVNVYPNKFDVSMPYRVVVRKGSEFIPHGTFTDVDVAAAVGSLVSLATFGDKAIIGEFDQSKVENHAEFITWKEDPRNAAVVALTS